MRSSILVLLLVAVAAMAPFLGRRTAVAGFGDLICLGEQATIVASGPGAVHGTGGPVVIISEDEYEQTIYAYGGNDVICASEGDTVHAGSGADDVFAVLAVAIFGESGNDELFGNLTGIVSGGSGNDFISGGTSEVLLGGPGNDVLSPFDDGLCDGGSGIDSFGERGADCATIKNVP